MTVVPESNDADSGGPSDLADQNAAQDAAQAQRGPAELSRTSVQIGSLQRVFEFPGVLADVPQYRERVMEFVSPYCSDEGDCIDIMLALQEVLANAALHGCKDDPAKRIHCDVSVDQSEVQITVRDPGPGFDLDRADPRNYRPTTLTHGRGICLVRSLMTEVTFALNGAEVRLRKRLRGAP